MTWWPSEERNGNNSWNAPDGWKGFPQSKTIMSGWHKLALWIFKRMEQDFRRNTSSVFTWWEWWREPPKLLRYFGRMKKRKGSTKDEKHLKAILEMACDWWNPFLHHTWKELRITPGELEELGKILGKDLWVRAHWREKTPLKRDVEQIDDAPEQ